jgi:multiple sugar transport system permease protein
MLRNAVPSIITVAIFSVVWQYNDTFYANLFNVSDKIVISKNIVSLGGQVSNVYRIMDSEIVQLYTNAGVVLTLTPLLIFYIALQKQFVEGVERSGIVG